MGIEHWFKVVEKHARKCITLLDSLSMFQNVVVGIDGNDFLTRFLKRRSGNTDLICTDMKQICDFLLSERILPLVVFDGKSPSWKSVARGKRVKAQERTRELSEHNNAKRQKLVHDLQTDFPEYKPTQSQTQAEERPTQLVGPVVEVETGRIIDAQQIPTQPSEEAKDEQSPQSSPKFLPVQEYENRLVEKERKYHDSMLRVTSELRSIVQTFLESAGYATIVAPFEADALLAYLSKENIIGAVASRDSDFLILNGTRYLIRNLSERVDGIEKLQVYDRQIMIEELGLSEAQLYDLAIILGCDMVKKFPGFGEVKALKSIKEEKRTIEWIVTNVAIRTREPKAKVSRKDGKVLVPDRSHVLASNYDKGEYLDSVDVARSVFKGDWQLEEYKAEKRKIVSMIQASAMHLNLVGIDVSHAVEQKSLCSDDKDKKEQEAIEDPEVLTLLGLQ